MMSNLHNVHFQANRSEGHPADMAKAQQSAKVMCLFSIRRSQVYPWFKNYTT